MKKNNKGFSLVELIVVMAIMAILAVTLAPRLMQYVDKARQANDRELINNIYTTVQYALVDDTIYKTVDTTIGTPVSTGAAIQINLSKGNDGLTTGSDSAYTITGNNSWRTTTNLGTNRFIHELRDVIGNFRLQSDDAIANADIIIEISTTDQSRFRVLLDYEGDGIFDYTLDSANAS